MESTVFDYAIIGAGAAGLHLAMAMSEEPYFDSKRILIIEKESEKNTYPTWCFWEKGTGKWDDIVAKTWNETAYVTRKKELRISLGDYTYKMVHGQDFHREARKRLKDKTQFTWVEAEIDHLNHGHPVKITSKGKVTYHASHIFDSRIDPGIFNQGIRHTYLKQHFEGWVIQTKDKVFDPAVFTIMDYRLIYPGTTSFTYLLPLNAHEGLVEYTFFSPHEVEKDVYETYIKQYISKYLGIENYEVIRKESGIIPMTDFPFYRFNDEFVTKIGTAGGWVKGSTGYSFKHAERKSARIVENIKNGRPPAEKLSKKRFRIYDALFLDVLYRHNKNGPRLFNDMYYKNDIELIFSFLDEETSFAQEVKIMNTFDKLIFSKAILKRMFR